LLEPLNATNIEFKNVLNGYLYSKYVYYYRYMIKNVNIIPSCDVDFVDDLELDATVVIG